MTRRLATVVLGGLAGVIVFAQAVEPLSATKALDLYTRMLQLMQSTTSAVPGLARAAAPVIENTRHSIDALRRAATQQDGPAHLEILTNVRAYLSLADALPKPYPFPQEGRRQFTELRESLEQGEANFRALLASKEIQIRNPDRDQLSRYAESNAKISLPQPGKPRVVFLGDSITDGWRLNEYFPEHDFINRGISGQITSQMLARMQADVIAHKPAAVLILAGTNDIARGVPLDAIQNNLSMMADLAAAHKIKLILASVLPVHDYNKDKNPAYEMTSRRPMETIQALNRWIEEFAARRNAVYLNYYSAMIDEKGFLKADLADDGLHPNAAGYRAMAPLAQSAIEKVTGTAAPAPAPARKRKLLPF